MIQGNIEAHLGESRYRVAISYDTNRAQARITALNAEVTAANAALTPVEDELAEVQADIEALKIANNELAKTIAEGVAPEQLPTFQKAYQQNLEILGELSNQAQNLKFQINQLKAQITSAQKQISFIESHQGGDETITAWSNEYNEDLTGVVAVELIGGMKNYPVIVSSESVNGRLSRAISVKREHCFSNLALLTGWLKWQQKHLIGVVQSVGDNVTASIAGINHPQSFIGSVQPFDTSNFSASTEYPYEVGDLALIEANNTGLQAFKGWFSEPRELVNSRYVLVYSYYKISRLSSDDNYRNRKLTIVYINLMNGNRAEIDLDDNSVGLNGVNIYQLPDLLEQVIGSPINTSKIAASLTEEEVYDFNGFDYYNYDPNRAEIVLHDNAYGNQLATIDVAFSYSAIMSWRSGYIDFDFSQTTTKALNWCYVPTSDYCINGNINTDFDTPVSYARSFFNSLLIFKIQNDTYTRSDGVCGRMPYLIHLVDFQSKSLIYSDYIESASLVPDKFYAYRIDDLVS